MTGRLFLFGLTICAALGTPQAHAEQDAQAVRAYEAPISIATPRPDKLLRCAGLFGALIVAPLGFGDRDLPDDLANAIKVAQTYSTEEISIGFVAALAFPDGAGTDAIVNDLGAVPSAFMAAVDRVAHPTESYFFNLKAELEAFDDGRAISSIMIKDFETCHPIVKDVVSTAPDMLALFEMHASLMDRRAVVAAIRRWISTPNIT